MNYVESIKKSFVFIFLMIGLLVWAKESQAAANVLKINTPAQILKSWYLDKDGDGYGADASKKISITKPTSKFLGVYVNQGGDCNDFVKTINPSAAETCDGKDNNCSGKVDEGLLTTLFYQDADGDSFGNSSVLQAACSLPAGYVTDRNDCNDSQALAYPGATEICDEIDNNCDGTIDEGVQTTYYSDADGDLYGNLSFTMDTCALPVGYVINSSDCDDSNSRIKPSARETCDLVDNDCDGSVDEGYFMLTYYQDADGDGYGNISVSTTACMAPSGYVTGSYDCNDSDPLAYSTTTGETCDGADNNCDGVVDEGITYYQDSDGDGYGVTTTTTTAIISGCSPAGYATRSGDCNDSDAAINRYATETYNDGIDNNCDGNEVVYSTTTIDSSGTVGSYNSIGVDSNHKIHIAYYDETNGDLKYATNSSGAWVTSTIESTGTVGTYVSLEITGDDDIYISYFDTTNNSLKYATKGLSSSSWSTDTIDSDASGQSVLAWDYSDGINISYLSADQSTLQTCGWNGSSFQDRYSVGGISSASVTGTPTVIGYDGGDSGSYGSWTGVVYGDSADMYYFTDFTGATIQSIPDISCLYASAAVDPRYYNPLISCYDNTSDELVVHDVIETTTIDSDGSVGKYSSIYASPDSDLSYISYYDETNGDLKLVASSDFSVRETFNITTLDSTGNVGTHTSLVLDENDSRNDVFISYYDETNGDLKYATVTACGNSTVSGLETCDDGNLTSGDGCSSLCQTE